MNTEMSSAAEPSPRAQSIATALAHGLPRHWRRQWLAYLALAPYLACLMVRHRSLTLFTAANPGIHAGGAVGESKSATLSQLRRVHGFVATYCVLAPHADRRVRARSALVWMERTGLGFPVVMKPDVGERGWGVALIRTSRDMQRYLHCVKDSIIVQRYVEGVEAGIFYCRRPGASRGSIVSIAQTHRRHAVGKGSHGSLTFGFGCRDADFIDARRCNTPALRRSIDELGRAVPGFYFGRFDVRASSIQALKRGEFRVIELNGVLAEPTHIYDPAMRIVDAYATLCNQWRAAFEIGAANRARGSVPLPAGALIRLLAMKFWRVLSAARLRGLARTS